MLAVEVCEPTCPAAAEDEINFEDTALKEEEQKHMQMHRSNLPETHTKRKFHQICDPWFGQLRSQQMPVLLWPNLHFLVKRCFYGHGFRSDGINMYALCMSMSMNEKLNTIYTYIWLYMYTCVQCMYVCFAMQCNDIECYDIFCFGMVYIYIHVYV